MDELDRLEELALATGEHQLDIELEYLTKRKELLLSNGLEVVDIEQQIALKKIDISKHEKDEKEKLEVRERNMKAETHKRTAGIMNDGLGFLIEVLGKDEAARKRNAKAIKAFEIAKIATNLYSEISATEQYYQRFKQDLQLVVRL